MKKEQVIRLIESLTCLSENLDMRGIPNKELQEIVDKKLSELIPLIDTKDKETYSKN
jgi:hypothetical protein